MKVEHLLQRIDELLELGKTVLATRYSTSGPHVVHYVRPAPMAGFRTACLSFIDRLYGSEHPHFKQFTDKTEHNYVSNSEQGIAILSAIRAEIAGGWLFNVKGLVAAEVFSDFLEMAEHLLEGGYKDPAAIMIGSVLEEHLRQLCLNKAIQVEEERDGRMVAHKADRLNADLAKAEMYTKLDQKLITAWLDLRNNAAHGKYDAYTPEQVKQLLAGVTEFMVRVSL